MIIVLQRISIINLRGGLGFNIAFGWMINDNFAVELSGFSSVWKFGFEINGTEIELDGLMSIGAINLKYAF